MSKEKQKAIDFNVLGRVVRYAMVYRSLFYLTFSLSIIRGILVTSRPMLLGYMLTTFIKGEDKQGLWWYTLVVIGLLIVENILQFFVTYFSSLIGQRVIKDLRVQLYNKISSFRLKYFDDHPIGRLVTRTISDIETVADTFSQGIFSAVNDLLVIVFVLVAMFVIDWKFALVALLPIPILLWATRIFQKKIKHSYTAVRNEVSNLNTFAQERITGMKIVQIFNREKEEAERFSKINAKHRKAHINSVWAFSVFLPTVEILSSLSRVLVIAFGLYRIGDVGVDSAVLVGAMLSMLLFIERLYRPIRMLADKFNVLQMGVIGSERVFKVLDTEAAIQSNNVITEADLSGQIAFQEVDFAYVEGEPVLRNLSLEIRPGETVAFVGATGAGKTSVINLLTRFYEYQRGTILVDGKDLRDYSIDAIRSNIALVLQDVFLFSDTVHNNITLGNPEITREQVIEAAKFVGAHAFIERLPNGYDFNVRERGGTLSVGQRQLISFIRAYVYNPKILILDEATSSIDTESELLIQKAIDKLTRDRTSIVIAHRLSTIQQSDRIVVLEKGVIIEQGNHEELLQQGGHYRKLHDLQFKHEEERA